MGQAKRAKNGTSKSYGINWKAIMQWLSFVYLTYITVGYCLICPEGYVEYDVYKSKMFWIPSLIFALCEIALWAFSVDSSEHFRFGYKEGKHKIDFVMYALLAVWGISTLVSANSSTAFLGDEYRHQGFLFFGLALIAMFLISHIGGWNKVSTGILMTVLAIVYVWQMLNYFGIVPFDWQMNRQYPFLVACLANVDQNAAFDGIAIAAGTAAFVLCKNKLIKALWGVLNVLCIMGAISTRSDSFYLGLAIGAVIIVGYSLRHKEYIRSTAIAMALYLVGIFLIRLLESRFGERAIYSIHLENTGAALITSDGMVKILTVMVVAFLIMAFIYSMLPDKITKVIHLIYVILVAGGGICAVIYFTGLYFSDSQSDVAVFLRDALASRAPIWKYSIVNMGYQDITHQLFGVGFGNFNRIMDRYSSVVYTIRDYAELADAHNIVIDLFVATGALGVLSWLALLICAVVKFRRSAGHYPWAMIGVMLVAGVIATGLANTSLIIVTPWVYVGIGIMLYQADFNERTVGVILTESENAGETVDDAKKSEADKTDADKAEPVTSENTSDDRVTSDIDKMEWAEVKNPKGGKGKKKRKGKN